MLSFRFRSVLSVAKSLRFQPRSLNVHAYVIRSFHVSNITRNDLYDSDEEDIRNLVTTKVSNSLKDKNRIKESSKETQKQTIFDNEREMFQIRRQMTAAYSLGEYRMALGYAEDLLARAGVLMGKRNAVYASCLNNVALMLKALGEQEKAMEQYVAALHVYHDIAGQDNTSYASALANIGVLYKEMSKGRIVKKDPLDEQEEGEFVPVKGLEKLALLDRAEEALVEARDTRIRLLGAAHKDSLYSSMHLASLLKMQKKPDEARLMLTEALAVAEEKYTKMDLICASLHNDLGVLLKSESKYDEAKEHYLQALNVRSNILGDAHNDTVICTYNLAELYSAMGQVEEATKLHEGILTTLEQRNPRSNESTSIDNSSSGGSDSSNGSSGNSSGNNDSSVDGESGIRVEVTHSSTNSAAALEYQHKTTSTTTTPATTSVSTTTTTNAFNGIEEKPNFAKIVAEQQQKYTNSTQDSEEDRKRRLLAQTSSTTPFKPATRRGVRKTL